MCLFNCIYSCMHIQYAVGILWQVLCPWEVTINQYSSCLLCSHLPACHHWQECWLLIRQLKQILLKIINIFTRVTYLETVNQKGLIIIYGSIQNFSSLFKTTRIEYRSLILQKLFLQQHTWHMQNANLSRLHLSCIFLTETLDFRPYHPTLQNNNKTINYKYFWLINQYWHFLCIKYCCHFLQQ